MKAKKIVKNKIVRSWRFLSAYSAFHRLHKSIYNSPGFQKVSLTKDEKTEYRNYWKAVSPVINFKTVEISKSLSGSFNKRIIPEEFYSLYLERFLNNERNVGFLAHKSVYNKWFGRGIFPKDFFHKLDGSYYTYEFKAIDDIEAFIDKEIDDTDFPIVIKPNKDSYGGKDVYFVDSKEDIKEIIKQHPNLVVQEKIEQSELINAFNKDSINTVRVSLYKDKDNVVHMLNSGIRMGKDGSLDNVSDGGIVCSIKLNGILNKYATDIDETKYLSHPNSGFVFEGKKFPLYQDLVEASKNIARSVIGARIISLDMALDSTDKWRCIEINLFGQTIRIPQNAGESFLGEYTDEIISDLIKSRR
ncbi:MULTISPECIES: sugar-transfer associated ATP-grasp domain-containing protein [unclassified Psychrobacter]|uniref:sugar-transfer associated ATP-grasp domain-containing protein n=1 Tax=unclassified Psychrobacter TaxID=196806 RepID=UPI00071E81A0|nr:MULTISPECIES: sugar-transfer associated ATP-grasp domain-containing protein [unclassified Psychrobacter]OLF36411.1 hypothetical protein BTV98_10820 [Psychrobacter sp. Cmf 22.2]